MILVSEGRLVLIRLICSDSKDPLSIHSLHPFNAAVRTSSSCGATKLFGKMEYESAGMLARSRMSKTSPVSLFFTMYLLSSGSANLFSSAGPPDRWLIGAFDAKIQQ